MESLNHSHQNFISPLNLGIALIHLLRSDILSIANNDSLLEILNLRSHKNEYNKICVDMYA